MRSLAAAGTLAVSPSPGLSSRIARYLPRKLAFLLGVLLVCAILSAGLWPFHAPRNNANWLPNHNGLAFGPHGVALTSTTLPGGDGAATACTLEILLAPKEAWKSGTVLSLFDPASSNQLALRQNYIDLAIQRRIGTRRYASDDLIVEEVFRRPLFLVTLSSNGSNTLVYINGELAANSPTFGFSARDLERQIIVGTSAMQPDSWTGEVRGLALYRSQLDPALVAQHYQDWTTAGRPQLSPPQTPVAVYPFDERAGSAAHSLVAAAPALQIPLRYTVVHQLFLEPFWQEFRTQSNYLKDALVNIAGFMPLGFWLEMYVSCYGKRRRTLLIVLAGFAVSLTIEVVQSQLPTRFSGTTDLITNTLGTVLGLLTYRIAAALWERKTVAR